MSELPLVRMLAIHMQKIHHANVPLHSLHADSWVTVLAATSKFSEGHSKIPLANFYHIMSLNHPPEYAVTIFWSYCVRRIGSEYGKKINYHIPSLFLEQT